MWDDRNWQMALKADNPGAVYTEIKEKSKSLAESPKVEDLSSEQQAWLRAT